MRGYNTLYIHKVCMYTCKRGFNWDVFSQIYISKPEPSISIDRPWNHNDPQRFLRTWIIGSVEALDVFMGFHQYHMSRQVILLQTELFLLSVYVSGWSGTGFIIWGQWRHIDLAPNKLEIYLKTTAWFYYLSRILLRSQLGDSRLDEYCHAP